MQPQQMSPSTTRPEDRPFHRSQERRQIRGRNPITRPAYPDEQLAGPALALADTR